MSSGARSVGKVVGDGFAVAGRWLGRTAAGAGRSIAAAYNAVDPDVRRHVAQLPIAGISYFAARERPIEALPDDGHLSVLFVHGLGGHRGNFLGIQALFGLAGRKRTYALGLDPDASLEEMAAAARAGVERICEVNGLPTGAAIDLVAHSMGGLVARLALADEATRARVATLVTMGTPHAGTHLARFAATPRVLELRPDSETMRTLQRQVPWRGPPEQPRLVCLWSASDVFLLPAETACVEGAQNVEMPGFTHYGYLIHPGAGLAALDALRPPRR